MSTEHPTPDPEPRVGPWDRWGWLFGGIWLFFFLFPLTGTWTSDLSLVLKLTATALIASFMVSYVVVLDRVIQRIARRDHADAMRLGLAGMAGLVVLLVLLGWVIGPGSLTGLPFIVGLPVFFLDWRRTWQLSIATLGVAVVLTALIWGLWPTAFYWGIAVMVLGVSALSRYFEERQEESRGAQARAALAEDRERVARDVHDVLGHSLTVVSMKTELARRLVDADPERAKVELAEVEDLSRQALAEIRATVGGLRIARLADEVESARVALAGAGIHADLPSDLTVVDPRHRITLAWVLREAVTNVVRHSRADRCSVQVDSDRLSVSDDGRGIEGRREGNGLRGLRERVQAAGGELSLGPGPSGTGTQLEVRL